MYCRTWLGIGDKMETRRIVGPPLYKLSVMIRLGDTYNIPPPLFSERGKPTNAKKRCNAITTPRYLEWGRSSPSFQEGRQVNMLEI